MAGESCAAVSFTSRSSRYPRASPSSRRNRPLGGGWGEGKTASSDGQRFRAGGRGEATGQVNLRYGNETGVLFYTHISDRYTPFYSKVIAANARDATYVLDGLLYHESDLDGFFFTEKMSFSW